MNLFNSLMLWKKSTEMCSPESYALLYSIITSSVLISLAGVYVWMRFIRTQPAAIKADIIHEGESQEAADGKLLVIAS